MLRTPLPVKGCDVCRSKFANVTSARRELARAKRVLRNARDENLARYIEEGKAARAWVNREQTEYDAHHAGAHPVSGPGGVVLARTDVDRAPSHRKPPMPPIADVAARIRAGETLEQVAESLGRTAGTLAPKLNRAGFRSHTGEQMARRQDEDGVSIPVHAWSFPPWVDRALCAQTDPEAFFPEKGGSTKEAKKVCNGDLARGVQPCPVREECLQWALDNDDRFGIYGGLSERERRRLKKGLSVTPPADEADWAEIREWARDEGLHVADVGRVSPKVVAAYRAAREAS